MAKRKLTETEAWKICKKNVLLISILIGVILGFTFGILSRPKYGEGNISGDAISVISYPGEMFLRALKLVILPFLMCCIITGSATLNIRENKRVAARVIAFFVLTSLLNVIFGITLGLVVQPGKQELQNLARPKANIESVSPVDGFLDMGRNLIPENIFQAMFQQTYTSYKILNKTKDGAVLSISEKSIKNRDGTNTLGIIFFCLVFGCILGTFGNKKDIIVEFLNVIFDVLQRMLVAIIWFTPVGVASVICSKVITVPDLWKALEQLALFVATAVGGFLFYQLIVLQLIYYAFLRKNPFRFYYKCGPALATAFATASKSATLPVMFKVMLEDLKMNEKITKFVLPIGTINLDGSALYLSLSMIFLSQLHGLSLAFSDIIMIAFASLAASMSSATVPSAAIVLVTMLCSVINIPTENVALLLSVDWLVDRFRTSNNMLGDCYTIAIVQHLSEKELNSKDKVMDHEISVETLATTISPEDKL